MARYGDRALPEKEPAKRPGKGRGEARGVGKGDSLKPEGCIREQLLAAALTLFTQRGYSATTVRELVEAAGVTKPVLYYYFKSKEGLFLELMRTHFSRLEAIVARNRQGTGSVRSRLMAMLAEGFVYVRENREFIRLMHAVYFGPPGGAPHFDFVAYHQRYHDLIARLLEEGTEAGEFRPRNAGDIAWIVLGTVEIAFEDQISRQASRIDQVTFRRLLGIIFDGLTPAAVGRGKGKTV